MLTICKWYQNIREICSMWIENNPEILGRMDENDNPITVEIDESYFFKRKYHKRTYRKGSWVFGAIERKLFNHMMIMIAELLR